MSVRSTIQGFYGGDAPMSLQHLLDRYRDEVRENTLREAAEEIRTHATEWQENYKHHWFEGQQDAADLIDPDKEGNDG